MRLLATLVSLSEYVYPLRLSKTSLEMGVGRRSDVRFSDVTNPLYLEGVYRPSCPLRGWAPSVGPLRTGLLFKIVGDQVTDVNPLNRVPFTLCMLQ